jgi:hypothetical protein
VTQISGKCGHYRIERLWGEATSETISPEGNASEIDFLEELRRSPDDE